MKVILREDVEQLGAAGDVVDVKPGYARNYLVPQGLAVRATKGNLAQVEELRRQSRRRAAEALETASQLRERLEDLALTVKALAGETGRLYGSVTNQDIARALDESLGIQLDRRRIRQGRPFRQLGEFSVVINLHAELEPIELAVIVEAENPEDVTRLGEDERELRAESFGIATRRGDEPGADATGLAESGDQPGEDVEPEGRTSEQTD